MDSNLVKLSFFVNVKIAGNCEVIRRAVKICYANRSLGKE